MTTGKAFAKAMKLVNGELEPDPPGCGLPRLVLRLPILVHVCSGGMQEARPPSILLCFLPSFWFGSVALQAGLWGWGASVPMARLSLCRGTGLAQLVNCLLLSQAIGL